MGKKHAGLVEHGKGIAWIVIQLTALQFAHAMSSRFVTPNLPGVWAPVINGAIVVIAVWVLTLNFKQMWQAVSVIVTIQWIFAALLPAILPELNGAWVWFSTPTNALLETLSKSKDMWGGIPH